MCGEAHARACARRAHEWARFSRLRAARKRRAQAAERRLQNAGCRTQAAERRLQNAGCRTQAAERRLQNAGCRTQAAERRLQNAE
ncbi:hypothetical protein BOC57_29355 [Burkholderia pseudomallei]|nr:hypothetical protein BOC57_29355 [Burkholderia pseudomallei]